MRTVLIDGDLLIYRFAHRGQVKVDWGDGVVSEWITEGVAVTDMLSFIKDIILKTEADNTTVCFTGKRCFRYDLLPSYKYNRTQPKPVLLNKLKEVIYWTYHTMEKDALEADDCLGILATRNTKADKVIASIDKDMRQIPGKHFNWDKDDTVRVITKKEADYFFYNQILTGDPTDGYSGCPNIGEVKAKNALSVIGDENFEKEAWKVIVEVYNSKGLDESFALTQARMARILRACDYNFDEGKPILWVPKV